MIHGNDRCGEHHAPQLMLANLIATARTLYYNLRRCYEVYLLCDWAQLRLGSQSKLLRLADPVPRHTQVPLLALCSY